MGRRARLGDDTIEQLFRQNYSGMIRLVRTLLDDDGNGMADDIVQDVFVRLLQNDRATNVTSGYLMTAVYNGCMNLIRQKSLREQVQNLYPTELETDITPVAQRMERLKEIQEFVAEQLEEPHRTIFRLRFDENLTLKAISIHTGLAIGTVHKYLQQSIQQVRLHFKQE